MVLSGTPKAVPFQSRWLLLLFECLASHCIKVYRRGGSAGLALIPELAEASQVFLAQLALELPIPDRLADDFTGSGVFSRFDGGFECGDLLPGEGDADFLHVGHDGDSDPQGRVGVNFATLCRSIANIFCIDALRVQSDGINQQLFPVPPA